MSDADRAPQGPISLDTLLDVLHNAGLLDLGAMLEVKQQAALRKRTLLRQREQEYGAESPGVSAAEIVAACQVALPGGGLGQLLDEARIQQALAQAAGLRLVRIDSLQLDARLVTGVVSKAYARRNCCLPLGLVAGKLVVAVDDPFATDVRESLATRSEYPIELVLGLRSEILRNIEELFAFRATIKGAQQDLADLGADLGNFEQLVRLGAAGREVEGDDRHVVHAVDFLLRYALDQGASDIHLEPKREQAAVRLRIDGVLHLVHQLPKVVHAAVTSRIKTLARLDIAEKRRPQDGRIKLQHKDAEVELRISTLPTAFGEKLVLRIFDPQVLMQDLDATGMFPRELELLKKAIARPHGLILVCGPTGSGKTTTLYSCLKALAAPTRNITTIEDPIEMVFEQFNQTAVQPKVGLTFAGALRTILRQDPDIIMVGEIRDAETAQNAIQAAMTGHLVLSTLHTNDAAGAIARLQDLGVQPYLIAATLLAVVSQRLLRTVCLQCRAQTTLQPEHALALGITLRPGDAFAVWKGQGCPVCRHTGLKGRTGAFELLVMTDKLRRLIVSGADHAQVVRQATEDGLVPLRAAAIKKLALGLTSVEEVLRVTAEADL